MAFSSSCCLVQSPFSFKVDQSWKTKSAHSTLQQNQIPLSSLGSIGGDICSQRMARIGTTVSDDSSFLRGKRVTFRPKHPRSVGNGKSSGVMASLFTSSQIASYSFTLGTIAVLPFYTFMVVAPKAELTKKSMESAIPYVLLGLLYGYLLYLSWTPDTIQTMFASKYLLPELPGIAKMFSREMTLASAWIHLLAVDLFAARQVYQDGLNNDIETRHSVSFCLLFCPLGILAHVITKSLTKATKKTERHV